MLGGGDSPARLPRRQRGAARGAARRAHRRHARPAARRHGHRHRSCSSPRSCRFLHAPVRPPKRLARRLTDDRLRPRSHRRPRRAPVLRHARRARAVLGLPRRRARPLPRARRAGPLTRAELAERAGIAPRYAREWLEQQAVAGLLDVEDADAPRRRAPLPRCAAEHARVLAEPTTPLTSRRSRTCSPASAACCRAVADAYRTGGGRCRTAPTARVPPRPGPHQPPRVHARAADRLAGGDARRRRPARVRAASARRRRRLRPGLLHARDRARVPRRPRRRPRRRPGLDRRRHAPTPPRPAWTAACASSQADAGELARHGPYDLVLILEALHDMADPVGALRAARAALRRRRHACWSSTSASPTRSPRPATRSSG